MYQIYEPRYSMEDTKWGDVALPGDRVCASQAFFRDAVSLQAEGPV